MHNLYGVLYLQKHRIRMKTTDMMHAIKILKDLSQHAIENTIKQKRLLLTKTLVFFIPGPLKLKCKLP